VSGIGWKDQLPFVDSDKNSNRLLLWCPVVHFPAILFQSAADDNRMGTK
jgi:hypothetical protein